MADSVIENIEKQSYCKTGYYTNSKGFPVKIDKAGRKGNGTQPNPATYNHAQSFYVRACCAANRPDLAYKETKHILPIEEDFVPVEKTFAPPYAIVNSYSGSHRAGFQFLSGTVSYVLRTVYNFFFGVNYGYDGLTLKPRLPKEFDGSKIDFTYLGKKFTVSCKNTGDKKIVFNGKESAGDTFFIADGDMQQTNEVTVYY